jgi:hypothetical protein
MRWDFEISRDRPAGPVAQGTEAAPLLKMVERMPVAQVEP